MTISRERELAVAAAPRTSEPGALLKLRGKVVVVVGASRGMGRAIALGCAREGADVVVVARGSRQLDEVVADSESHDGRCVPLVADARDGEQVKQTAEWVADKFGRVDVLVHAVGGGLSAAGLERPALREELNATRGLDFWRIADEDFDASLAQDLRSVFLCCKNFAPLMIRQGSGSIVVLGSYGGITGSRGWKDAASHTTKAAVHRLVAAVAEELKPYKVAANVLLPGLTLTSMTDAYPALRERANQMPEDCVAAAVFLATQDENGMTGRFVEANSDAARLPRPYMPISEVLAGRGSEPANGSLTTRPSSDAPSRNLVRPLPAAPLGLLSAGLGAVCLAATQRARHTGRAFRHPSFRLFFLGQSFSLPGTWMQRLAIAWLAYQLTGSAFLLGLLEFAYQIPALICGPAAGVAADRWGRRSLLLWTQGLSMLLAGVLAVLAAMGLVSVWHLGLFTLLQGGLTAFDQTARRSLLFDIVDEDKEDLTSAIGLNSTLQMAARALGPAAGGLLVAAFGGAICFLVNSVSYVPIIVALAMMRIRPPKSPMTEALSPDALWSGLRYTLSVGVIKHALLLLAIGGLFGIPYMVLLPIFSQEILGGGPQVFGFLTAASGAGSLVGAVYVAGHTGAGRLQWLVAVGVALLGMGLVGLAVAQALWPAMMFSGLAGFGMMLLITSTNTIVQTSAEDENRGRVVSWYTTAFNGSLPVGSLGAGALAGALGTATTLLIGGAVCLIGAAAACFRLAQPSAVSQRRAEGISVSPRP